jgi:hypothetical protein
MFEMPVDSATLQLTQWIINAAYDQRSLQSTPLPLRDFTTKYEAKTCLAFSNVITTSVV